MEVTAILVFDSGSQLELDGALSGSISTAIASGTDDNRLRTLWKEDEEEIEEEEEKEIEDGD